MLTKAEFLLGEDSFEHPEQRYILSEVMRYFAHPGVDPDGHPLSELDLSAAELPDAFGDAVRRGLLNNAAGESDDI